MINTEEIKKKMVLKEEQINHLEKIGIIGIDHLEKYLEMKDDEDFLKLKDDVHKLLLSIYHLSKDEEKYLEILGAENKEHALEKLEKIIIQLNNEILKDSKAIIKHENIDVEVLNNIIEIFKEQMRIFLKEKIVRKND